MNDRKYIVAVEHENGTEYLIWNIWIVREKKWSKGAVMRITSLFVVTLWLMVIAGCIEKRFEPDELINAIKASGCSIEKEGRIHHSLEGAQAAFWMNVDGKRVAAYQYSTVSKAKLRAKTFQSGFYAGYWAFEFADEATAQKIQRALKQ